MKAFRFGSCCCCPECDELASCTSCGEATDQAATYEVVVDDYPSSVECAYDPPGTPCDLSGVNGTYQVTWDHTDDASTDDVIDRTCVYTGSFEIGLIPGGCFGTGGGEHPVTLDIELSIQYTYDRRICVCSTGLQLAYTLRNDLGTWDTKTGGNDYWFDRAITCDEIASLIFSLSGSISDCFLGPVAGTVSKL